MVNSKPDNGTRRACTVWLLCCLALPGCRIPPVAPEHRAIRDCGCSRNVVLVRQLVEDSAREFSARPLKTSSHILCNLARNGFNNTRDFFRRRILLPLTPQPEPLPAHRPVLNPDHLEMAFKKRGAVDLKPASIHLELNGKRALEQLEKLIENAAINIDVLMYLWDSDPLGWGVARHLARRAKELAKGDPKRITVRALVDGGGNLIHAAPKGTSVGEVNEALYWLSRQPNIQVLRVRNALARFDHRKLMIIDDTIAWSGGRNFTLSSFFENHDLSYLVKGPVVQDLVVCFEKAWHHANGKAKRRASRKPYPVVQASHSSPDWRNAMARVIGTGRARKDLCASLCTAISHAKHHIYLENPYFTSNDVLFKLIKARQRGVDVRVVLAKHSKSDLVDHATKPIINRLIRFGVRVYVYPGTTHVKAAAVDGQWAYIGTGNFDGLSLSRNHEVGLGISQGAIIQQLEQQLFLPDFRPEWEVLEPLPVCFYDRFCEVITGLAQ